MIHAKRADKKNENITVTEDTNFHEAASWHDDVFTDVVIDRKGVGVIGTANSGFLGSMADLRRSGDETYKKDR